MSIPADGAAPTPPPCASNQPTAQAMPATSCSANPAATFAATMPARAGRVQKTRTRALGVAAVLFLAALTMGCNMVDIIVPATPTPPPTRVLAPTFTPTPEGLQPLIVVTPPQNGTPGVIIIQPTIDADKVVVAIPPTETPTPLPTPTGIVVQPIPGTTPIPGQPESPVVPPGQIVPPGQEVPPGQIGLPTPTPLIPPTPILQPTPTFTPAPTPTPFIFVESGYVALRTGPGPEYPLVAQLGPNIPIAIVSRNPQGTWFEICCVNGFSVWVSASHVRVINDPGGAPLVVANPPPPPTPTFTPTATPTVTPTPSSTPYPFERAIGPQFFPTENQFLTIWAKLFIGTPPLEQPAAGYCMAVKYEGFDRPATNDFGASRDVFEFSAPQGAGNRVQYNLKYEYLPPDPKKENPNSTDTRLTLLGTGTWSVFVTDCAGRQLSDVVTFTTSPSNPNREVYVGWVRVR